METSSPTILFMGTPTFAATALTGLVDAGFNVISVVCRPDEKSGRGSLVAFPATKIEAEKHQIPVYQPINKTELTEMVQKVNPELIVVAAFGMIIPQAVLDIPKYGTLNIHGSLLPKYRGASPIAESILNGDAETGITIMEVNAGLDEGDTISSQQLTINGDDTTENLTTKMAELGAKAIVETIPGWVAGTLKATPQDEAKATYCKKITKEDGHIDWNESAEKIERMVRAYQPWPTAYTFVGGLRIKILKASWVPGLRTGMTNEKDILTSVDGHLYADTGEGTLEILVLQPEGKKPMSAKDYINGNKSLNKTKLN